MRRTLRGRTTIGVAVVIVLGFGGAAIALGERGVDASDTALPLGLAAAATVAGATMLLLGVLRTPLRTIAHMKDATGAMARGALEQRVADADRSEVGALASSFNEMSRSVRTAFAELAADRHRFVAVVNSSTNGVIALDRDLHYRYLNPAAERILGVKEDDALGKPFLYAIHDADVHERLVEVRQTHQQQLVVSRLGPQNAYVHVLLLPLADAGDWAFVAILVDLTEVRRLEQVRREFVTNVSHELRTPLAALRAAIETLQGGAFDDREAAPRFFEHMIDEVERLTNLVDELLTLSRVETQVLEPAAGEPVDLSDVARAVHRRMTPQAERASIALNIDTSGGAAIISGDAEQISRAVASLVHNAIKFTSSGGEVLVATSSDDTRALIAVSDTGPGIAHEQRERIFERFYKADRSRSSEGSGLGLAIVKHIVQAHGGDVELTSEMGKGSTFRLSFPRRAPATPDEPAGST